MTTAIAQLAQLLVVLALLTTCIGCGDSKMRKRIATLDDATLTRMLPDYEEDSKPAVLIREELGRRGVSLTPLSDEKEEEFSAKLPVPTPPSKSAEGDRLKTEKKTEPAISEPVPAPKTDAEAHAVVKAQNPNYNGAGKIYKNSKDGIWGMDLSGCGVSTLEPLRGMPFTSIACADNDIKDLAPLKGMELLQLVCDNNPITDLSPISGMPIWKLGIKGTRVTSLTPLKGMKLQDLVFSPGNITQGIDIVRNMETIRFYPTPEQPGKPKSGDGAYLMTLMSAEAFWKLYDEQYGNKNQISGSSEQHKDSTPLR